MEVRHYQCTNKRILKDGTQKEYTYQRTYYVNGKSEPPVITNELKKTMESLHALGVPITKISRMTGINMHHTRKALGKPWRRYALPKNVPRASASTHADTSIPDQ
jgi:hypothetical protein